MTTTATTHAQRPPGRTRTGREIHLVRRPHGAVTREDFAIVEADVDDPRPGEVLVRNTWMSVDPYMRGRMDEGESYLPSFDLGRPLDGAAVGTVIASGDQGVPEGATVLHLQGWRNYALIPSSAAEVLDVSEVPAQRYLSVLGTTGLTAYIALTQIAPIRAGDAVLVSSAAGAVGMVAGQLAKRLGAARVVGSAGGRDKGEVLVRDGGYDVAIDYKTGSLAEQLRAAAPDGIDVYLDAVGGSQLEAAIDALNVGGRIAVVGAISEYDATEPPLGLRNAYSIATKRLTLRGMLISDHFDHFPAWVEMALPWLRDGRLRPSETVIDGLAHAPPAFIDMMAGRGLGKVLVRVAP